MLMPLLPTETLAHYADPAEKPTSIVKADGTTEEIGADWETMFPYGTFAFSNSEGQVTEGDDTFVIHVYRLGGTQGRATARVSYTPAIALMNEDEVYYGSAAGMDDIIIEVEDTLPIAQYQPVGKDPDPEPTAVKLRAEAYFAADAEEGDHCISLTEEADSYQWYVLSEDGDWEIVQGANEAQFVISGEDYDGMDVRCVFSQDGTAYCTDSVKGAAYEKPAPEALKDIPEDLELNPDPTFTRIEWLEPYYSYFFNVTFADGEWVKDIRVTAVDDDKIEAVKAGTFTIVSCEGGSLYDSANTLALAVFDNEEPEPGVIGFSIDWLIADKSAGTAVLTVSRTGGNQTMVSVPYATKDGTAKAGEDYQAVSGALVFYADITEQTIEIPLINDGKENSEPVSFQVELGDVVGDNRNLITMDRTIATVDLINSNTAETENLVTMLVDDSAVDASGSITEAKTVAAPVDRKVVTGTQVKDDSEPLTAEITGLDGDADGLSLQTYDYGRINFSRGQYSSYTDNYWTTNLVEATGSYPSDRNSVGTYRNWTGSGGTRTKTNNGGFKIEGRNGGPRAYLDIPYMSQMYSYYYMSLGFSCAIKNTDIYGAEFVYPWAEVRYKGFSSSSFDYVDADVDWDWGFFSGYHYEWKTGGSMSKSFNMSSNLLGFVLGLSKHDAHDADKGTARIEVNSLYLTRRNLNNDLQLRIHTANDGANSGDHNVATAPDKAAALGVSSGVYASMKPVVTILKGNGGVTSSGKLYVGSTVEVELKNTPSYDPYTGEALSAAVYVSDEDGNVIDGPQIKKVNNTDKYQITMVWDSMREADLDKTYVINVVMTRVQDLKLDISPSVARQKNNASAIDTARIQEAWDLFWNRPANPSDNNIYYGVSDTTSTAPHFSKTGVSTKTLTKSSAWSTDLTANNPDAVKVLSDIENLQWINFNRSAKDRILYNGRIYVGNETIYLDVGDLALPNATFKYYNEDYLSATSIMTTDINSVGIYLDANGNGQIDGYFNQETNYFILDEYKIGNQTYTLDQFIMFLDPNTDYDETTFAPVKVTINKAEKYVQCFAKVLYTMTPRSLLPPPGLDLSQEKAQVLPAFVTNITDPDNYAELTREQQSYRYIMSGLNQSAANISAEKTGYARSADNHAMYGREANLPQIVDVPLGGDVSPAELNAAEDGYEWSPDFQGNLLIDFVDPEPITIEHSEAGDDIPIANYTIGDDGTITLEDGGAAKLNGYLGSFTANSTITLCTQRQEKESQDIWTARHGSMTLLADDKDSGVKPEASNHSSRGTYPNSKYLQNMDAGGTTDEGAIDMGDSPNEFDELNIDLGVKLPSTDIGITDFFTILMDGYEVGFCIGIPLASASSKEGGKNFVDNMKDKGEDFGKMKNFLTNRKPGDVDESYKNATKTGNAQQLNTCGVEASLSLTIAFLFKYNSVDNGYYFSSFAIALNGSVEFKYQHRLKPAPIVYLYVKVGAELELGTGATVERETVEGDAWKYKNKDISEDNPVNLKKGETQYFDGPQYKAQNITFDGKIAIVLQEQQSDGWHDVKDSVKGYLKSEGSEPITATLVMQSAMKLPDSSSKVYRIKVTALENSKITGMVEVKDMSTKSYWSGVHIEPEVFLEVGGGVGIEILKFELFIKVSVGCAMTLGAYNDEKDDYDPFEFEEFSFGLALGFRVVLIAINYEMDLIGYSVDFDHEKKVGSHSGWSHSWHALGDLFGGEIDELSVVDSEGNYYGVKITLPGDASRSQTIYSNDDGDGLSTLAYNAEDKEVPFQMSGYGSSGNAFKLADGLLTGYAYQVVTVGDTNYLIYTISRKNAQHAMDNAMLVLSKLRLTSSTGAYGLVNPLDESSATPYILLDTRKESDSSTALVDDGAGDLDFRAWADPDGKTIHAAWVSYAAPTSITPVDQPDPAVNPIPEQDLGGGTAAPMDESNYRQFTAPAVPTEPTETAEPAVVAEPKQEDYYTVISAEDYAALSDTEKADYAAIDSEDPSKGYYKPGSEAAADASYADVQAAYSTAVAAYQTYQTDLTAYETYLTEKEAYDAAKKAYDGFMAWYDYFDYSDTVQSIGANAAKNTVVKTASFDASQTVEGFSEARTVSGETGSMVYLPGGQGDGTVVVYAKARPMSAVEKNAAKADFTAYLTKIGYDPTGATLTGDNSAKEAKRTVGNYRLATQVGMWDGYGKGTDLYVSVNGTPAATPLSLADGQILDNFEITKIDDTYYLAYTTSEYQYTDGAGSKVTSIEDAIDQVAIKRLFLRTFTVSEGAVTWTNHGGDGDGSKGVLLRTLCDFDENAGANEDGIFTAGGLMVGDAYNDPYFGNLQFLNAKLGDSLTGADESFSLLGGPASEKFLLFEMNGATFVIRESSLKTIVGSGHTGQIIPFFSYETASRIDSSERQPKTTHAESTGRAQATIGADGDGNLAAVYVAPVTGTSNNAVYISKYDPVLNEWGAGTMLAMNHMDVYEASLENDWTADQLDQAYLGMLSAEDMGTLAGKTDKGGMDQFTFGSLQIALGMTKTAPEHPDESGEPGYTDAPTRSTLLVLAQGTTSYLEEYITTDHSTTPAKTRSYFGRMSDADAANKYRSAADDSYWKNRKPGVGVYALSFGVGGQAIGEASLTFADYDFSAGAYLHPNLSFVNTGDVGIRGSQSEPIIVRLIASGDDLATNVELAKWEIVENIVPGQKVKLSGDLKLPMSLPIGTVLFAAVAEDAEYAAFAATTETLLTVEKRPELGFESLTIKPKDVDNAGNVILSVNGVVGNRGTETAGNVTLQFSYDTGRKKYEGSSDKAGTPIFAPLSLIGNTLEVGKQELLSTLSAPAQSLEDGIFLLQGEDGSDIRPGYCRTITGTITVSPDKFRALTDSLSINLEIFSDADTYTTDDNGLLVAEHGDYNTIDNLASNQIKHNTFFSVASKVVVPMGNTMRLPVSITTTTGATVPQIAVTEFSDTDGISHLGVLYYQPGTYDGKGRDQNGTLVLAPSSTGNGLIRIQDANTSSFFDVAYTVTEAAEGINIFNDTTLFTFYNDADKTDQYDPEALAGTQNWSFPSAVDEWGVDETAPYLDNLARGKVGTCFTFDTKAESIDLVFNGTVKVDSTFPGFSAQTISANGGDGNESGEHASVRFGTNGTNYTHTVTVTVLKGAGSSDMADFDRLVEHFGSSGTPLPAADAASPHIYWSRSFPDTASINSSASETVPLTAFVLDDGQLASVILNGKALAKDGDATDANGNTMTVHSDGYWEIPLTIAGNDDIDGIQISATDTAGNRTAQSITVDWFNTVISAGASADKPELTAKLMKDGDSPVELTAGVPFTKTDTAYIAAEAAKSPATLSGDVEVTTDYISVDTDPATGEPSGQGLSAVPVSADGEGRFPVSNNGWYLVTAKNPAPYEDQWTAAMLHMGRIDIDAPVVVLAPSASSPQSENAPVVLDWSVTKKNTGTVRNTIQSVTINGAPMTIAGNQTAVSGSFQTVFGGEYVAYARDTAGNDNSAAYILNDVPIRLAGGKTESDLFAVRNAGMDGGGSKANGSVVISSDVTAVLVGGTYLNTLSADDKAAGNYVGSYEWNLVKADEPVTGEALTALLSGDGWTTVETISALEPGRYVLYFRDRQDSTNDKTVAAFVLTLGDETITVTADAYVDENSRSVHGIDWAVAKGEGAIQPITSVTVNGYTVYTGNTDKDTHASGSFPVYYAGEYRVEATDGTNTSGRTVTIEPDVAPILVIGGKTTYVDDPLTVTDDTAALVTIRNAWNQEGNNGSLTIDPSLLVGGQYDRTASSPQSNAYKGSYEWTLYSLENFDREAKVAELTQTWLEGHPDITNAADIPEEELDAIKAEADRLQQELEGIEVGGDRNVYENLTAGTYRLVVRDKLNPTSRNALTVSFVVANDAIGIAAASVSASSFSAGNGQVTVTASGGYGYGRTYEFILRPIGEENATVEIPALTGALDPNKYPDQAAPVWLPATMVPGTAPNFHVFTDLPAGWYQVAVRPMLSVTLDEMAELSEKYDAYSKALTALNAAKAANEDAARNAAVDAQIRDIGWALISWRNARDDDKAAAWTAYLNAFDSGAAALAPAVKTAFEAWRDAGFARGGAKDAYDDAVEAYVTEQVNAKALAELAAAEAAYLPVKDPYETLLHSLQNRAGSYYADENSQYWANAATTAIFVGYRSASAAPEAAEILPEDLTYPDEHTVIVSFTEEKPVLSSDAEQKLIRDNSARDVVAISPTMKVLIPKGTLSAGDDVSRMLMPFAELPANEESGNVVLWTGSSGKSELVAWSYVDSGVVAYIASRPGSYSIISNVVEFADVPESFWGHGEIGFTAARAMFGGVGEGRFDPDGTMTRAMFVTVLGRMNGVDTGRYTSAVFGDVAPNAWYGPYVAWAAEQGIVNGVGEGRFDPDSPVTREQLCTILCRYLDNLGLALPKVKAPAAFPDADRISDWSADSVSRFQQSTIVQGDEKGFFNPQKSASRAEAAAIYARTIKAVLTELPKDSGTP